jgi:tRNA dimethylallyltransferase
LTGKSPLLVILGPTAVGKTDLAIHIAQALGGEIINADSRQIYRYMDIGTAKPTIEQQALIPHHLLDIVEPDDNLGLAQYQTLAYQAISEIIKREHIPMLVGGTGQYITAVTEGWSIPAVPPNDALRTELEVFAAEHGSEALHKRLQTIDQTAATNIDHRNVRRVIRALEVCLETGQRISELQRKHPPPYHILRYGLTLDRETLYERADQRIDLMMKQGFLEEVQGLLNRGYNRKLPSMSGLGYAQLAAHILDGVPLEEAVATTKNATHDFIRRQYTWFKGHDSGILWHNINDIDRAALMESMARWIHEQD